NSAEEHVNEEAENWDKITYPMLNLVAFLRTSSQHYNTLIENYQAAIEEEWSPTKLAELNMISPFDFQEETFHPGFGYELRDINKDGIQELILGVNREDGRTWIQEIYTLVNDTPVKVFKG